MSTKRRGFLVRLGLSCAVATALGATLPAAAPADTAAQKAGRGLAAMTTGFLELPGNMVHETRKHGPAYGWTVGFAKGLGGIVVRELVGVYEFVSSPFAVPAGYEPILSPEYPWDYFDESKVADEPVVNPDTPNIAASDMASDL